MSTTRMSSRSSSQSSGDDNGSVNGSLHFGEIPLAESSHSSGVFPVPTPELLPHHDWRSLSSESFQCRGLSSESVHCRGLSWQDRPGQARPDPHLLGADAMESTRVDGNHSKNRNFLGLTANLTGISNFERRVTNLVRHLESRNEAEILKAGVEVEDFPKPTAPSSSQSESSIATTDTVIISTGLSMAGSSRIRELKVKRNRNT
ncbi:hypothetical protein Pst134EB_012043 [Puccinia striiformis f. sp. tritici]|nr:hypothetical protein Pst134EB_012043 [Puccinia striiformis f. sp. tritici]